MFSDQLKPASRCGIFLLCRRPIDAFDYFLIIGLIVATLTQSQFQFLILFYYSVVSLLSLPEQVICLFRSKKLILSDFSSYWKIWESAMKLYRKAGEFRDIHWIRCAKYFDGIYFIDFDLSAKIFEISSLFLNDIIINSK